YMPECPVQLLGRDMLSKLQAQITFLPNGTTSLKFNGPSGIMTLSVPKEEEWRLYTALTSQNPRSDESLFNIPGVWAENNPPGLACNIPPIKIELKLGVYPVSLRQYHIPQKAKKNIQSYLDKFIRYGILKFCTSPWNTPLLPVQKPGTDEYRPVQDLRAVNDAVVSIHPVVPNPYNLLALIPGGATYFTVLDLKDAFFCLRIAAESQCIFAFQWENAVTGSKRQMTWTRLPQGFKNSPTLFGSALSQDLLDFESIPGECVLLQYVDDLLIAAVTKEICQQATHDLLHILWKAGYKVSRKKAQLCLPTVKYLGFHISEGQRIMGPERKEAVCQIPIPKNRRQVREFLGAAGFCRIWIPSYAILAKPLYAAIKGTEHDPFLWTQEQQTAFEDVKKALMSAPALGLPDHTRPFYLYVHEQRRMAVGVLTQYLGSWQRPVAYMSKQLDAVASGLPPCLRAVAAAALLVAEADKLTLGQELYVRVPHAVQTLLDYKGNHWFSNSRMTKYQAMLCENPRVHLETVNTLNPATLLPQPTESQHDCLEVMDEVFSSRPDLRDFPIQNPDVQYYTDGSSYVKEGIRYAGYAVTTIDKVIEARPLAKGTSAQKAELIALTRALQLAEGLRVNIYMDSKYAFLTTHAHGALYKERGLLNSEGKEIKYAAEILQLLECQDKHLDIFGPLAKLFDLAEIARAGNRQVDPEELCGWVQRAICIASSVNASLSIERRKAILFKIEPKLANLALTEAGKDAQGLLFGDSFIKDLGRFVGAFTALDKAQSSMERVFQGRVSTRASRFRGRLSGRSNYHACGSGRGSYTQRTPYQETRQQSPFFPSRGMPWRSRGFRGNPGSRRPYVRGFHIELVDNPCHVPPPRPILLSTTDRALIDAELTAVHAKGATELGPVSSTGVISNIFLVEKKGGQMRPVINLCALNTLVRYRHFKMGNHLLRDLLLQGDWMAKLDLKDAYLTVPVAESSRDLLRFLWKGDT
ncbi:uncharacterized protein LOC134609401, partial [Pelobates fuscus]|uniref:uncharacterized protein LOC134609401 n=1 Tax=Pelobates fuscus TaxID=191477 RepID=UPI002FE45F71